LTRAQALLRDVNIFLNLTGMKPTNLGKAALNDPALYFKLKRGRRLYEETEERLRRYMEVYSAVRSQQ